MTIEWENNPEFDKALLEISKEKGLIQREIAERMTTKFNTPFTRNSVKGRLSHIKEKGYEVRKSELLQQEDKILTRKEINHNALNIITILKKELAKPTPYNKLPIKVNKKGDSLIIHLTDWHAGKKITDEFGKVLFNEDVFKSRIDELFKEMLNLIDSYIKQGTPIKDTYVLSTGDLVDGMGIFSGQEFQSEMSPPFQVMLVVEVLQKFILSLLERDLIVNFKGVKGNHGEIRYSGKSTDPKSNWDTMIYLILQFWQQNILKNKELSIIHSELDYFNFDIQGWKYHIRHKAPVQSETAAGKAKFLGWIRKHNADCIVSGHYHHYSISDRSGVTLIRGGSITGADEFSEELAEESSPTQLIWGVTKKRPLSFSYAVDLGHKGRR